MPIDLAELGRGLRIIPKVESFLHANNLRVEFVGDIPKGSLCLATHPTKYEGMIHRLKKGLLHAANSEGIRSVPIDPLDQFLNIMGKRFIPVYKGDPQKRRVTYEMIGNEISHGNSVVLNPTGLVSGKNAIPHPNEIQMGTYRIIQHIPDQSALIPVVVFVDGEIVDDIATPGSKFRVMFGEPYQFPEGYFAQDNAPEDFRERIVEGWRQIANDNNLGI